MPLLRKMQYPRYDAHRHLPDGQSVAETSVVNGTSPEDWADVLAKAKNHPDLIPAIGLHPWKVNDAPEDWQAHFLGLIGLAGAVGEIGLDQWIDGHDIKRQEAAFCWQLKVAAERNLPVSIHSLKASEVLLSNLRQSALPRRGIHLHAYSGSAEQVEQFAEMGAYFSFHAGQFKANAKKAPAAVQAIPRDRLLIETDAPNTLDASSDASDFLNRGYDIIAGLRGVEVEALAEQVAANFQRYFLDE